MIGAMEDDILYPEIQSQLITKANKDELNEIDWIISEAIEKLQERLFKDNNQYIININKEIRLKIKDIIIKEGTFNENN